MWELLISNERAGNKDYYGAFNFPIGLLYRVIRLDDD